MKDPREVASDLEARATVPDVPDRERVRGYAVPAVSFRSGHTLAMRRFPASSIGPAYTSLWHRDPSGRLVIYQDQEPRFGCPRAFGPVIDETVVVPVDLDWPEPHRFEMKIETADVNLSWDVPLTDSVLTRAANAVSGILPDSMLRHPLMNTVVGRFAGPALRAGRVRLTGLVPSGQSFNAHMRYIWLIGDSTAVIDGEPLREPAPLSEQPHLADFWLPQRGFFAVVDGYFEPYDASRHQQVSCRREATRRCT